MNKSRPSSVVAGVQPRGFKPVTWQLLETIVQRIVANLQPQKIILFGSYGYGSPTPDSDVDLLVITETQERPTERYLTVSRLIRPRPFPLDILVKTPLEINDALTKGDFFISEIMTRGRILYERSD
ncbi:MAG: nucleotidyltransferase domain-containing protein [Anaerolineae bacterium]